MSDLINQLQAINNIKIIESKGRIRTNYLLYGTKFALDRAERRLLENNIPYQRNNTMIGENITFN